MFRINNDTALHVFSVELHLRSAAPFSPGQEWLLFLNIHPNPETEKVSLKCCLRETSTKNSKLRVGWPHPLFPPGALCRRHCHCIRSLHTLPRGDRKHTAASGIKTPVFGTNTQGLLVQTRQTTAGIKCNNFPKLNCSSVKFSTTANIPKPK